MAHTPIFIQNAAQVAARYGVCTHGNLPHWHIDRAVQFVTFRLADSLPQNQLTIYKSAQEAFLHDHPLPWSEKDEQTFYEEVGGKIEKWLAAGYGSCCLRIAGVRRIVEECLAHFAGVRYVLYAYVIMPNHVHVLFEVLEGRNAKEIVHTWKSYTAHKINAQLGTRGNVWQRESFDRIIRSEKHFHSTLEYIRENPRLLAEGEYTYYERKEDA